MVSFGLRVMNSLLCCPVATQFSHFVALVKWRHILRVFLKCFPWPLWDFAPCCSSPLKSLFGSMVCQLRDTGQVCSGLSVRDLVLPFIVERFCSTYVLQTIKGIICQCALKVQKTVLILKKYLVFLVFIVKMSDK